MTSTTLFEFPDATPIASDIAIYNPLPWDLSPVFWTSTLEGKMSGEDLFGILDLVATLPVEYMLERMGAIPTGVPPILRSSVEPIQPGCYRIRPIRQEYPDNHVCLTTKPTFADAEKPQISASRRKKAKAIDYESEISTGSARSFKMRLIHRDKGCIVCHATGMPMPYRSREDLIAFDGAHIVPMVYWKFWDIREMKLKMTDPYTDPANAKDALASPTTRSGKDGRRMNSLDNGLLLCANHHRRYDSSQFSIHPTTHKIFAFKPNVADLHGLTVTAPWAAENPLLPSPHPDTLEAHYLRSVVACMKGAENHDDDDDVDDSDEEEQLLDLNDVGNEHVTIWDEHSIGEWALGGAATGDWVQHGKENKSNACNGRAPSIVQ